MGSKTNYFRHSLDAHNDPKIIKLIGIDLKYYAYYFILLEIYGRLMLNDDEQKEDQEIEMMHYARSLRVRSDSCRSCLEVLAKLQLIEALRFNSDGASAQLRIPKFMKYFGRYQVSSSDTSCKQRKEKENKIKESNTVPKQQKNTHVLNYESKKEASHPTAHHDLDEIISIYPKNRVGFRQDALKALIEAYNAGANLERIKTSLAHYSDGSDYQRGVVMGLSKFISQWENFQESEFAAYHMKGE